MANYSHDRIVPFKDSELGKKQQIAEMFDKIALRYDFLNHFLSGGIDLYWRRRAIRELRPAGGLSAGPLTVLDVATGTGDLAILLTRYLPGVQVTGIDISAGMLGVGRQKVTRLQLDKQITLLTGDSEALQFPDGQFDAVTVAFGVRNFENLEKGLREMLRVLKPGGKLVVLEFSKPRLPGIRQVYDGYLRLVAPKVGKMISSSREAYQYLNDSVRAFPEGKAFTDILDSSGYSNPRLNRLSLGICSLYTGVKPA
ncbi:MAG TPA: bifunctional demethylmenaquinone methyltransferase/2-methoxy-6-polyprenyl-1,4-benzoquinol methylase UbiE [Puia sp.]|nr:bifunctional demethylmenaquinone methyltransferase/2-methoxy-6-polyprenyl-1,4-benzoquinol methylase UbiE [Puia sp.]